MRGKVDKSAEFTIELNPESIDPEKIDLFLENGINRISIGAQSFSNDKLNKLGRVHDRFCAEKAVKLALDGGFKNISIDMIFGVRGETLKEWKQDLGLATNLPVTHISCYSLDCEKLECGNKPAASMYEYAIDHLAAKDFKQYEISNFAKDGFCCRHNLNYWDNSDYIGLGPSAVSYAGGVREENVPDISDYINRARQGESVVSSSDHLEKIERARETAAVKIRTMEGINFGWFMKNTGFDFLELEKKALSELIEEGLLEYVKDAKAQIGVRVTRKGILFCDIVSSALL